MAHHTSPLGTPNIYPVQSKTIPFPSNQAAASAPADAERPDARQLVATMKLVKSARFNAAERLERKQKVSLATQSIVALYFIGVAVYQAVYIGQIDDATNRLLTFIQIVSSVFTLMLGLLESLNDYQMKSHHLANCALTVSELSQEMKIARVTALGEVQEYRRRYHEALRACPVNHNRIDFQFALLDGKSETRTWAFVYSRYICDVYGLYAIFLCVPPLLWWLHR